MLILYTIGYFLSLLFYHFGQNVIASVIMVSLAIFLCYLEYKKDKRPINIAGLFALGFVGGFGVSLLKLSALSDEYSIKTIITIFVAFFSIYLGTHFTRDVGKKILYTNSKKNIKYIVLILFFITFVSFVVEVCILKFIPLFTRNVPHAYSTFHVFMLHYITTLYVFIPTFAIVNYYNSDTKSKKTILFSYIYVIILATLLVSRSQLIMSLMLSVFTYAVYNKNNVVLKLKNKKNLLISLFVFIFLIIIYIFITINRAHDINYLNGIFEMKDDNIPIYVTQPYMYVAHNFENLNYMINNIEAFGFGRRMLMPLWTLTFVKKLFPTVAIAPVYVIKEELSTLTLIYDFYYDFGISGVVIFCFIIGYLGKIIENYVYSVIDDKRPTYLIVLFSLLCYYMLFSFFQTYFSLTETLIYILTILLIEGVFIVKNSK